MALFQRIADLSRKERNAAEKEANGILADKAKKAKAIAFIKTKEPGFNPANLFALLEMLIKYLPEILKLFSKKAVTSILIAFILLTVSPLEAGPIRNLLSRLRPSGACASCNVGGSSVQAGPKLRKECVGGACRMVEVK